MTGITAAHMLHEQNADIDEVRQFYHKMTGMPEAALDTKMRFLSHSLRKPFVYCYWRGNEAVRHVYNAIHKGRTWEFLRFAYFNMNSVNSARQFLCQEDIK
jgi:hypothetical protein